MGEFGLAMNRELLCEGQALTDFMGPNRIVLGHDDPKSLALLERLYASSDCDKLRASTRTAELIKCARNALLAVQISAANEIANLAAVIGGIDAMQVMKGVHLDRRWNPIKNGERVAPGILSYLLPGPDFGGSCLPMAMTEAAPAVNRAQPVQVIGMLERAVGPLKGKRVLVLGLAFKPGTDDAGDSPSIPIPELLLAKGAPVSAHHPMAGKSFLGAARESAAGVALVKDWRAAAAGVQIVIVATKWPEYRALAKLDLAGKMVFDSRRMFPLGALKAERYLAIGLA
jgi:UDPglucose 6-dehydrogenase